MGSNSIMSFLTFPKTKVCFLHLKTCSGIKRFLLYLHTMAAEKYPEACNIIIKGNGG